MPAANHTSRWPERLIPGADLGAWIDHFHRYRFCRPYLTGLKVLEIGSGEGYGADYLAQRALRLVAIDLDPLTVLNAHQRYPRSNLTFMAADARHLPFGDESFDAAVAFEVIEHLADPDSFLGEIKRVLKPRSSLWLSTPNIRRHYEKIQERNPFHLADFDLTSFQLLLQKTFAAVELWGQTPTWDIGRFRTNRWDRLLRKIQVLSAHPRAFAAVIAGKVWHQFQAQRDLPAWDAFNLIDRRLLEEAKVFIACCKK